MNKKQAETQTPVKLVTSPPCLYCNSHICFCRESNPTSETYADKARRPALTRFGTPSPGTPQVEGNEYSTPAYTRHVRRAPFQRFVIDIT